MTKSSFKYAPISHKVNHIVNEIWNEYVGESREKVTVKTTVARSWLPSWISRLLLVKQDTEVASIRDAHLEVINKFKNRFYDDFLIGIKRKVNK